MRQHLRNHLTRKRRCNPKDISSDYAPQALLKDIEYTPPHRSVQCSDCNKKYTSKTSLSRHKSKCKGKAESEKETNLEGMVDRLLDKKLAALQLVPAQAPRQVADTINNNNTVNLDNSKHLHITFNNLVEFKDANYKAVQAFFKKVPLNEMIDYVHMDVDNIHPKMMKNLFFNEERKENITLAVTDIEKNEASIFEDGRWQKGDAREIVNDILLVNATEVKNTNYNLPKDLRRDSNELNSLFNGSVTGKMVRFAHENLPIVEAIHGKIFT